MMKSILMTIFYLGIQLMALNLPDSALTSGKDSQKAGTFILKNLQKYIFPNYISEFYIFMTLQEFHFFYKGFRLINRDQLTEFSPRFEC